MLINSIKKESNNEQIQERGKCRLFKIIEDVVNEKIGKYDIFNILFKNGSYIQNIPDNCSIRGKRSKRFSYSHQQRNGSKNYCLNLTCIFLKLKD